MLVFTHMERYVHNFQTIAYVGLLVAGILLTPVAAYADYKGDVGVWIPWWTEEAGAESALEHIEAIDTIYPFTYEVSFEGNLINKVDFDDDHWEDLFGEARDERVDIIPTIAWFDGAAIDFVLGNDDRREEHIEQIVDMVDEYDFDGVNIDYEQKLVVTRDDFSDFLEELEDELGRKDLTCTVEARMDPERRYRDVPDEVKYSNDYRAMNKYCDRIEIMAYDQQRADLYLNDERRGVPYSPVADNDWVEHVIEESLQDFDADKVLLGVATYGRAWDVTVASEWYKDYTRVATLNYPRIEFLSDKYDSPMGRSVGGEGVITYFPEDSPWRVLNQLPTPEGTPKGYEAAAKALLVATYADIEIPVRFVAYSDAKAIEGKMKLADKYDLDGIAIFKVDGEEDPEIWELFED